MVYLLWRVSGAPAISTLSPLKLIYGGDFLSRHCRTLQKTIPIAAIPKNAAIDPMYSDSPKKRCNRRHIAAFLAPIAKKLPQ